MTTKTTPPVPESADKKDAFVSRSEFDETVAELQQQIKTLSELYERVRFLQSNSLRPLIRKVGKNADKINR